MFRRTLRKRSENFGWRAAEDRKDLHQPGSTNASMSHDTLIMGSAATRPVPKREIGIWLYNKEKNAAFMRWCKQHNVRMRNTARIAAMKDVYSRTLRANRDIYPGEAIITAPLASTFNMLTVARDQYTDSNHVFPLSVNWKDYDTLMPELRNVAKHEVAVSGWIVRQTSLCNDIAPWFDFMMGDTCGKEGVSHAFREMGKARQDEGMPRFERILSELCVDAAEEPNDYMELFYRAVACYMRRSILIEPRAIKHYLDSTGFLEHRCNDMQVPTLIPLVDCIPQIPTDYNCTVDYFEHSELTTNAKELLNDMGLDEANAEQLRSDPNIQKSGVFVCRALRKIMKDESLSLWSFPKLGDSDWRQEQVMAAQAEHIVKTDPDKHERERAGYRKPNEYLENN